MAFDIFDNLDNLPSREIRQIVTGAIHGIRQVDDFLIETEDAEKEDGGLIPGIINGLFRFGKMLFEKVFPAIGNFIEWTLSGLWGLIVSGTQTLWNFNWNVTNEELQQQIDAANVALAGTLGETIGTTSGQLVCGVLPGSLLLKFNQSLGLYALKEVGEEILDELASNLATLVTLTGQQLARVSFSFLFQKVRDKFFPNRGESEPWSFAIAWENFVDEIDNERLQEFVESLFEGATEACANIGYILWGGVDNWLVQSRLQPNPLGTESLIELQLNKSVPNNDTSIRNRQLIYGPSTLLGYEAVNRIESDRQLQQVRQFQQTLPDRPTQREKGLICVGYSRANAKSGESFNETQISFRTKEDIEDLLPSVSRIYALRTRDEFAKPPLIIKRGKIRASYGEPRFGLSARGYMVLNEAEGRKLFSALVKSATGREPKWNRLNFTNNAEPTETFDQTPPDERIAGELYPGVVEGAEIELVPRYCKLVCGPRVSFTLWDLTGKLPRDLHTIDI
ncbi:MAG: hypothetical protein RID09_06975 [Coleofasciculus sp. G1-WW12-02]|uniref:hypothetical protein n=1 Tax=Coleofasciculus sp. G1-WW12-02 TaxID=3068483 RepID=UPI0032F6D186